MWRWVHVIGEGGGQSRRSGLVRVGLALALAAVLIATVLAVTLSGSPVVVARANSAPPDELLAETYSAASVCQPGEILPAGTSAIRVTLASDTGPQVKVSALSGTDVLTGGVASSGWTSGAVTVPVKPLARTVSNVRICFKLGPTREQVGIIGSRTSPALAARTKIGRALPGRITIEYLRPSHSSWWSLLSPVARRMGLGRAPAGTWIVLLVLAMMGAAVLASSWLIVRELR